MRLQGSTTALRLMRRQSTCRADGFFVCAMWMITSMHVHEEFIGLYSPDASNILRAVQDVMLRMNQNIVNC